MRPHLAAALLAIISAARVARADPDDAEPPAPTLPKPVAATIVAALYGGYATWSYFAWYRGADFKAWHHETPTGFQVTSYAGGADKLGHTWATYSLARATTALLAEGGWNHRRASFVGSGLSELAFFLTEYQDGFTVGFDNEDMLANTVGAGLALAMDNLPAVDRLFDFRLVYFPSPQFRHNFRNGSVDVGQDYTGQTYLLALHLDAVPRITDTRWTAWAKYADVVVGFESRHYSPAEDPVPTRRQVLYAGVALDMQHVLARLFCGCTGRRVADGIFEVASIPYTTLPIVESTRELR